MTKSLNYASSNPKKNSPNIVWERLIFVLFQGIVFQAFEKAKNIRHVRFPGCGNRIKLVGKICSQLRKSSNFFASPHARNASSFSVKQYEACRSADDNHLYGVYLEKLCAHKRCHKQEYAYVELPRINAWRAEVFGGHEY